MSDPIRGILPVLQTPVAESGDFDIESMERQIDFCIAAGAGGLVFPVLGGEFQYLSDRERQTLVEIVVKKTDKRIPVIVGVAGTNISTATEHAAHAGRAGADAVIAMPPYMGSGGPDENLRYFEAISSAGQVPIFIQNAGAGMQPPALVRLLTEVEHLIYVKEEANPSAHHISAIVAEAGRSLSGRFWRRVVPLDDLRNATRRQRLYARRPGCRYSRRYLDAFQAGDEDRARDLFDQLLPLTNLIQILGLRLVKEVLIRRGIFKTSGMRAPGSTKMDADDHRELDAILAKLRPLFRTEAS